MAGPPTTLNTRQLIKKMEEAWPICRKVAPNSRKKIGKLGDQLHQICGALATMKGKSVEQFGGTALYVFLGKCVIEKHTRAKPRRWSDF